MTPKLNPALEEFERLLVLDQVGGLLTEQQEEYLEQQRQQISDKLDSINHLKIQSQEMHDKAKECHQKYQILKSGLEEIIYKQDYGIHDISSNYEKIKELLEKVK